MTADGEPAAADTQNLTDVDTYVYETIATLEYTGRPVTRAEIASAADLDDQVLNEALEGLVSRGILRPSETGGEAAFEPAERGWSAAPDQTQGM